MPTILRFRGFRIMMYVDDHPPPHVHAEGQGSVAAFLLRDGSNAVMLRGATRLPAAEVAALRRFLEQNSGMLMQAWRELHHEK